MNGLNVVLVIVIGLVVVIVGFVGVTETGLVGLMIGTGTGFVGLTIGTGFVGLTILPRLGYGKYRFSWSSLRLI